MNKMKRLSFPEMVKEYLNEHFQGKPFYQPYEVHVGKILKESLERKELKWSVQSPSLSCYAVEEDIKGQIWIVSDGIESIEGWFEDYHIDSSQLESFLKGLQNKRNWRKYKKYKGLIPRLKFEEKIAKLATKKTGVKVALFIPPSLYFKYCHFYSVFDASNMMDDQKMEEIKRRAEAIFLAHEFWRKSRRRLYRERVY
ncbi:MAG: hypothetical protein QW304_01185 [Thermoproteota archaeon]